MSVALTLPAAVGLNIQPTNDVYACTEASEPGSPCSASLRRKKSVNSGTSSCRALRTNVEELKQQVQANLSQQDSRQSLYETVGPIGRIVSSPLFEQVSLVVITFNGFWIAVDVDHNKEPLLVDAHPVFQVAENLFCLFFCSEWSLRFMALYRKVDGLRDGWLVFDAVLILIMVLETWGMYLVVWLAGVSNGPGLGGISVLRLCRLIRLTRMVKVFRAVPELVILLKAMVSSARSVALTMALLGIIIYVFAVIFAQSLPGTEIGDDMYTSVAQSMLTLFIQGIMPDQGSHTYELARERWYYAAGFMIFVTLSTLLLVNMLIGIICEVVSAAAGGEKERADIDFVRSKLLRFITKMDVNRDGLISKAEFFNIVCNRECARALKQVGVQLYSLIDHADCMFEGDDFDETGLRLDRRLSFEEFMKAVLELRDCNNATVRDISELRKFVHQRFNGIEERTSTSIRGRVSEYHPVRISENKATTCRRCTVTPSSSGAARLTAVTVDADSSTDDALAEGTDGTTGGNESIAQERVPAVLPASVVPLSELTSPSDLADMRNMAMRLGRLEDIVLQIHQMQGTLLQRLDRLSVAAAPQLPAPEAEPSTDPSLRGGAAAAVEERRQAARLHPAKCTEV